MLRTLKIFTLLFFLQLQLKAQDFYVCSSGPAIGSIESKILYRVTRNPGGDFTYVKITSCTPLDQFFSIAIKDDNLYWIIGQEMYKGTIRNDELINCQFVTPIANSSSALTVDNEGRLYFSSYDLHRVDLSDLSKPTSLGKMNYSPTGDLVFYKGELYMAAAGGIVHVNPDDPLKSYRYLSSVDLAVLYGLVNVSISPQKNVIYGLAYVSPVLTNIIEIDLDNKKVVGVVGTLPFVVLDGASIVEDGSILGIKINNINTRQDCNNPTKGRVEVLTEQHIGQFTYTLNGISNTTGIFNNIDPGTYTVTVTSNTEQVTESVTVPAYSLIKPSYAYTVKNRSCGDPGEISFTTTSDPALYQIQFQNSLYPLNYVFKGLTSSAPYRFDIVNQWGCKVDEAVISVSTSICPIQFDKVLVEQQCDALYKGKVTIKTKPHIDQYTYLLNGQTNTTGSFENLSAGKYPLKITSPDDEFITEVIVPDYKPAVPLVTYTIKDQLCESPGEVTFTPTGTGSYKIRSGSKTVGLPYTFTGLPSATYTFEILNDSGCKLDVLDISIVRKKCTIQFTKAEVEQQCDVFYKGKLTVVTGSHPDTYTYSLNTKINQTGVFTDLDPGKYELKITSPEDQFITEVIVPDYRQQSPAITYQLKHPSCAEKGSIAFELKASSKQYLIRYGNATYPLDHIFSGLSEGPYKFTVVTPSGCLVDEYDLILKYEPCVVNISTISIAPECAVLGKAKLTISCPPIPETYTYTLDGLSNATGVFSMLNPGTYKLRVSASGGRFSDTLVTIPDYNLTKPVTGITKSNPVCTLSGKIILRPGLPSNNYRIRFNSTEYPYGHVFEGLIAGVYQFDIIKPDGCIADHIEVTLVQESCNPVSFPTAFTPNNDGNNDTFRPDPKSIASSYRLQIFDRWGALVFRSTNLSEGWTGDFNGSPLPVGTYFWVATFINQENKAEIQKGSLMLVR